MLIFKKDKEVKKQVELSRKYQHKGFIPLRNYIYSWRMDEYLGGVQSYYEVTKDKSVLDLLRQQEKYLNEIFDLNYIPGYININTRKSTRLAYSRGYQIIEVCLESSFFSFKTKKKALGVLDNLINRNSFFKKKSLFLNKYSYFNKQFLGTYIRLPNKYKNIALSGQYFSQSPITTYYSKLLQNIPISYSQVMKDNSNLVYSIIEAYKHTKNNRYKKAVKKWILKGVIKNLYDERGFIYTYYKNRRINEVLFSQNFTVLDIFIDYLKFFNLNDDILRYCKKIADFWLSRSLNNYLIPDSINKKVAELDCQTDFSVSLRKLYDITGEEKYLIASNQLFNCIIENFFNGELLVRRVNHKGNYVDKSLNVKYNALFLKAYIAKNHKINIFNPIFKDR